MKNVYLLFTGLLFFLSVTVVKADDTFFTFGQNLGGAPQWKYIGGGTNLDAVNWKTVAYPETGWLTTAAALGFGTGTPVRNTAIPEDASTGGGGIAANRYPTLYFRKTISVTDPNDYTFFRIRAKFDDAIVVWVNGVEAFRNNITADPAYATLASSAISGNGATIFTGNVSPALFVPGNNCIAVEIHQSALNSTDLFFDMELVGVTTAAVLTRGPYLQMGNQDGITIRWRTDIPTTSKVSWGNSFGTYPNAVDSTDITTEHIVRVQGLNPDTKYFYSIGSNAQTLLAANNNYFLTMPPLNTTRKLRFVALGDCGNASTNQVDTKNALLSYIGSNDIDGLISLGDNAYSSGLDTEFQDEFFDIYKNDILRNMKLYPAPGNHDYGNSSANTGVRNNAYYSNFSLPDAGQCGGTASGTEAYYSFDIGDVHFISLDSYGRENTNTTKLYDTTGAQCVWLKSDLAANTRKWVVVYFHHPPYTKTSHNSDTETGDLGAIRENFIRILERYGVDLVLNGHAHGYERSYLLRNYYKANAAAPSLLDADFRKNLHTADSSSALYNGAAQSCAYKYNSGKYNHGTVYVVSGSAGQLGGSSTGYPHDAMYYSNISNGGSLYFEVDSNRLDARFISYSGTGGSVTPVVRDQFTIFKDVNKVNNYTVAINTPLTLTASWRGSYLWPNNSNAASRSVTIGNTANGTFNYFVRDANNCIRDSFVVTVTGTLSADIGSFNAMQQEEKVLLSWNTLREMQSRWMVIEKSADGIHFNELGRLPAAGHSTQLQQYRMTDAFPATGVNYYRLSQVAQDGTVSYHGVRTVNYKGSRSWQVSMVSNSPGSATVNIRTTSPALLDIKLNSMTGALLWQQRLSVNNSGAQRTLAFPPGLYVLTVVSASGETASYKIMIR